MKNRFCANCSASVALALFVFDASSAEVMLKPGDPAPKLEVSKWVQGDPVTAFETGKVYIVEFWATWCGPCVVTIPYLNELHLQFKDRGVVVIGQDVLEQNDSAVPPFVAKMGTNMTYRVALDDKSKDPNGAMVKNWMEAAGQKGIPTAFVINKQGRIAWIGHPLNLKEKVLEDILADRFDIAQAVAAASWRVRGESQPAISRPRCGTRLMKRENAKR
jgi:thiol-disulfide isomerase/thioredoxin